MQTSLLGIYYQPHPLCPPLLGKERGKLFFEGATPLEPLNKGYVWQCLANGGRPLLPYDLQSVANTGKLNPSL